MSQLPKFSNPFSPTPNSVLDLRAYRSGALRDFTRERAVPLLLSNVVRHPTCATYAWRIASILEFGKLQNVGLDSPFFLDDSDIKKRILEIESYPKRYGQNFLDVYYNEFVTYQNSIEKKWTTESIIEEVFHGKILHSGAICIGKFKINNVLYLFVGHDKNHSGGRATTEDHRSVIEILKSGEFDRVIYWVDTPGADSGARANATHQAACMSELITTVSTLSKPSLTVLAGEGGSGGAEVFFGSDFRVALAQSYFSTIHPIGHAAIIK